MTMAVQGLNASMHAPEGANCSGGRRPNRGNGGRPPPDRGPGKVKKRGSSLLEVTALGPCSYKRTQPEGTTSQGTSAARAATPAGASRAAQEASHTIPAYRLGIPL
ncbi:uncharacterized protein NFIA_044620 [Aspergillus fischeri NRRL 181]|uniref:Uncharacterized protein n=1 Tax=Neosartorya fischeri (strain ATCC 1020 / DSM 3700 / CBS 544.65 / FGSC A1164 / JCM 1740 / NRRL 181 / WB 181) TaxID=331117 RepID=A1CV66_NEOFI|nr:uncharacterized protein NFIA_044620 [Aspergillus fischeri NRRL 181]EAW25643.1 hypothetical protein NFIA_044620 [Aspergillus fischeri NRRL 181]KAG2001595.1 hypothetical protein GB937_010037 [Aspergillus fischeri]